VPIGKRMAWSGSRASSARRLTAWTGSPPSTCASRRAPRALQSRLTASPRVVCFGVPSVKLSAKEADAYLFTEVDSVVRAVGSMSLDDTVAASASASRDVAADLEEEEEQPGGEEED
jgi:hypothetical protein